jgi:hypothetical protein
MPLNPTVSPGLCEQAAADMIDISHFMRQYQQAYARYVNKAHNRRGTLWADRFKSTILEGERALWNCVKYVELNPVRARLCGDPADYRWCSWGRYCGSGRHPFAAAGASPATRACGRSSPCAQQSRLGERAFQKIILQGQLADLGVQRLQIDRRLAGRGRTTEDVGRSVQQLPSPLGDLRRVHLEVLRNLGHRLVASDGGQRHLGLECRRVVAPWSLAHVVCS